MEQRPKKERQEELGQVRDLHLLRDERDRERTYLLLGLAASAAALGLLGAFLFREGGTFGVGRLAAFGVLYFVLRGVAGLLFVGLLLAVFGQPTGSSIWRGNSGRPISSLSPRWVCCFGAEASCWRPWD